MPIDTEAFKNIAQQAAQQASAATNDDLADQIASLTRLTTEDIQNLFPDPGDVKKLAELMTIVKSAESHNNKLLALESDIKNVGGVALTLLNKLV